MPSQLANQYQPVVADLLEQDPDQLYAELGKRMDAVQRDASLAGSVAPVIPPGPAAGFAPLDTLKTFGKQFFDRWSVQAYNLVCGSDEATSLQREELLNAFTSGTAGVGALLAALLVAQLGLAPAAAGVVAALIIKLFFNPAYEAMCAAWKQSLPGASQTTAKPAAGG